MRDFLCLENIFLFFKNSLLGFFFNSCESSREASSNFQFSCRRGELFLLKNSTKKLDSMVLAHPGHRVPNVLLYVVVLLQLELFRVLLGPSSQRRDAARPEGVALNVAVRRRRRSLVVAVVVVFLVVGGGTVGVAVVVLSSF